MVESKQEVSKNLEKALQELDQAKQCAKFEISGMRSKPAFLRQLIVAGFVYDVDYSYLREYNYLLGKIGANLNQIAKRINETRSIYRAGMDEVKGQMEKLWEVQKVMLKRQSVISR